MVLVYDMTYEMAPNVGHWYPETREDTMAEKLARTRTKRGGNQSVMTKLSKEANYPANLSCYKEKKIRQTTRLKQDFLNWQLSISL